MEHPITRLVVAVIAVGTAVVFVGPALMGCATAPSTAVLAPPDSEYRLVHPARVNPDGTVTPALYERHGVTDRWYTPALNGKDWVSLMR